MTEYQRIIITGGTGVLGRALLSLADEYPGRVFIPAGSKDCNLTLLSSVMDFFNRHKPDAVLHFAALAGGIQYSMKYPAMLLRDNVLMNFHILEAARLHNVKKTVLTLSSGMYPENAPLPLKESCIHDGPPHTSNYSYAFAKRLMEPSIRAYRAEYGMSVIGVIPNGIYGEHMNFRTEETTMLGAVIRRFYENRDNTRTLDIWGDGSPLREFTYSRDLARASLWCLDHYEGEGPLNIGSTEELSVALIARSVAKVMGIDEKRLFFDTSKPAGIFRKNTDNSKFVGLSGFRYTPFQTGLERTVRWFMDNYSVPGAVRL